MCESTYTQALSYYKENGFTLVILGDVEELWEENIQTILASYPLVFELEADFFKEGRYLRIYGNHDSFWHVEENLREYLGDLCHGIQAYDGLVLSLSWMAG